MTVHTILRWHVRDKRLAWRLRQHCRTWIDTSQGSHLRSIHGPGLMPSRRVLADHRKNIAQRETALIRVLNAGVEKIRWLYESSDLSPNLTAEIMTAFETAAEHEGIVEKGVNV